MFSCYNYLCKFLKTGVIIINTKTTTIMTDETILQTGYATTSETLETTTVVNEVVEAFAEKAEETAGILEKLSDMMSAKLPSIIFAVIILIIGIIVSKFLLKFINRVISRANLDKTANGFLKSFIKAILYVVVIIVALTTLGVPMASIITVVGAAGLALSLALQQCLTNVAGGFIILFSKPFKVGDFIEINNIMGTVETISILYTRIVTPDNKVSYVPNGVISNENIVNRTTKSERRLDLIISISYDSDFRKACTIINEILEESTYALKNPESVVGMTAHGQSSIDIDVKVWVKNDDYMNLKYEILEKSKERFDENGIGIPYNVLDVNIHSKGD